MNESQGQRTRVGIMIVEDDAAALDIASRLMALEFPDAALYSATDGVMGIELFKKHMPDIVITDIGLPKKDGIEMARDIKLIRPETKFIVLTAYNEKGLAEQFNQIGIDSYLLKPVNFDLLITAIGRCIEEIGSDRTRQATD